MKTELSGFIISADPNSRPPEVPVVAGLAFLRKGMRPSSEFRGNGYVCQFFANASHDPGEVAARESSGSFCAYVGTLIYRGRTGRDATALLNHDLRRIGPNCLDAALGNYCVVYGDQDQIALVTDRAGLHHVYLDDRCTIIANSFIAAATAVPQRTFRTQEVLEYIQCGATFGRQTLVDEVKLMDPMNHVRIHGGKAEILNLSDPWAPGDSWQGLSAEEQLSQAVQVASDYYRQVAATFGDRATAALSGGYDTRLNLALLGSCGIVPKLFVYGSQSDVDVRVAQEIARGEGLPLSHIDRAWGPKLSPDDYWKNQESVFHGLDGLTQYGFACEPFEISHRHERVEGRLLAINGGGGEIWRDYWKLPDRRMTGAEFVDAHFAGRFSGISPGASSEKAFMYGISVKVGEISKQGTSPLSSAEVQSLYPRMRLRFWQGKNNSVDNHIGYAITPFSESCLAVPAMWIPMSLKRDGWFERQLILRISTRLASYRSSHGYDLKAGPSLIQMAAAAATRHLPRWVRARRRRLAIRRSRGYFHAKHYINCRFGSGQLEVERYVETAQLADYLAFSRALTIERMLRGEWA